MGADGRMLHREYVNGPGGVHCPCCGATPNARPKDKRRWKHDADQETGQNDER